MAWLLPNNTDPASLSDQVASSTDLVKHHQLTLLPTPNRVSHERSQVTDYTPTAKNNVELGHVRFLTHVLPLCSAVPRKGDHSSLPFVRFVRRA